MCSSISDVTASIRSPYSPRSPSFPMHVGGIRVTWLAGGGECQCFYYVAIDDNQCKNIQEICAKRQAIPVDHPLEGSLLIVQTISWKQKSNSFC